MDPILKAQQVIKELRLDDSPLIKADPKLRGEVEELIREHLDIFTDKEATVGNMGPEFHHEFRIRLEPGAIPVRQGIRPLPLKHKESLKEQLAGLLGDGVIRVGHSPWGSAQVPVFKKVGSLRWTVDYRGNKQTIPDSFPNPRIVLRGLGSNPTAATIKKTEELNFIPQSQVNT